MEVVNFSYYFQGKEALRDKNLIASTPQLFPGTISSRSQTTRSFLSRVKSHFAIGGAKHKYIPLLESRKPHQTYRTAQAEDGKNSRSLFSIHAQR